MYVDNFKKINVVCTTNLIDINNISEPSYTYSTIHASLINFKQDIKEVIDAKDNWMLGFGKKCNRDIKALSKSYKKSDFKIPKIFKQFG